MHADTNRIRRKHLAEQRHRRLCVAAAARRLHRSLLGLDVGRSCSIAPASTSLASAWVGTPNPGTSMPMMRTPLISFGSSCSGTPGGGRHAQIDDDHRVVKSRVGELEYGLADVLEQLAGDQASRS